MRNHSIMRIAAASMFAGAISICAPAFAHEGPSAAAQKAATPSTPATAAGIWQAIDAKNIELRSTIATGSLANVHHQAFAIRDLVAALPAHYPALTADKLARARSNGAFVATLAGRLDTSGDANDRAGSQASYDRLAKILIDLRATYAGAATR